MLKNAAEVTTHDFNHVTDFSKRKLKFDLKDFVNMCFIHSEQRSGISIYHSLFNIPHQSTTVLHYYASLVGELITA